MSDLRALYQEVIIDHNRQPRNFYVMPDCNRQAQGFNPLCGDRLTLYLLIENDRIKEISFRGTGCAISMASASLMTEALKGQTEIEAENLFEHFHRVLTSNTHEATHSIDNNLGKLTVLLGVRDHPSRIKCATLAWHALRAALAKNSTAVSTEEKE